MYLAGISVRRVEDITEALWGTRVSPSTVSNLNKKIYAKIEACLNLAAARLRHIAGTTWSAKCYMNMRPLYQQQQSETEAVA
jgi:hypothetical protein